MVKVYYPEVLHSLITFALQSDLRVTDFRVALETRGKRPLRLGNACEHGKDCFPKQS